MKKMDKKMLTALMLMLSPAVWAAPTPQPDNLKVNHLASPLGVDDAAPRLEWRTEGIEQSAYEITVGTDSAAVASGKGSAWQSGRVASGERMAVYGGEKLRPTTVYFWRVSVSDGKGNTANSDVARFETGLMGRWHGA